MSTIKVNNLQNASGGSNSTPEEIQQGRAKAWVNFNGSGTVAIRDDYNISSVTDNGTGDYTINISNAMSNANYAYVFGAQYNSNTREMVIQVKPNTQSTTAITLLTGYSYTSPGSADLSSICMTFFGD